VFSDSRIPDTVWVVMPAFNAERTLRSTVEDLPLGLRERVILVNDASGDNTITVAEELGLVIRSHDRNRGYGANQKTCYQEALARGADYVVMVHPDNQYDARMAAVMVEILALGNCDMILGNRIRTRKEALEGGMPRWKYFANRLSTLVENLILGQSVGDFHSGMRAYTADVLRTIPIERNSDDFAFDQEFLVQAVAAGFRIGDVPVPVRYMEEASSINFKRSLTYAWGGLRVVGAYLLHRYGVKRDARFNFPEVAKPQ